MLNENLKKNLMCKMKNVITRCMGSVDGWDRSIYIYIYIYISIKFKSPLLHNGCTFIVHRLYKFFFIKVENLKPSPNLAYKWFHGMLIHYTLQKIAKGHKKWPPNLAFVLFMVIIIVLFLVSYVSQLQL